MGCDHAVMDGIDACREITELLPGTRVLMLTASNEQDAIVRAIAAGATGYLQKYSGKEQLLTTLREVALGEFRIPGDAARRLARAVRSPSADDASGLLGTLTEPGAGDPEAVCRGVELPGDRRGQEQQRPDGAERCVRRPEEAGFRTRQQMVLWAVRAGLVDAARDSVQARDAFRARPAGWTLRPPSAASASWATMPNPPPASSPSSASAAGCPG